MLVLGMFIEGIAVMVICLPMLLPVAIQLGVDPLHFGVIVVLNMMIGLITPPVGLCLYAVSQVAEVKLTAIIREIWPYLIALVLVLLLITYFAPLSMWVPTALGF